MTISLLLIALSLALFAYWFRYSCILILRTKTAEDFASDVARVNGLSFELVRGRIEAGETGNAKELFAMLNRDYEIVTQMIDRIDSVAKDEGILETQMLRFNFRVSQAWFRTSQALGLKSSTTALEEMTEMVSHFANSFGEWNSVSSSASSAA